jgi:hypothetical protein
LANGSGQSAQANWPIFPTGGGKFRQAAACRAGLSEILAEISNWHSSCKELGTDRRQGSTIRKKGDWTMSGFKFERQLIAAFAALLMSTIAVGAAVAPAQVSAATVEVVTYA